MITYSPVKNDQTACLFIYCNYVHWNPNTVFDSSQLVGQSAADSGLYSVLNKYAATGRSNDL